jgi:L-asparaginase
MRFSTLAIAGLTAVSSAAPTALRPKTRQAQTASERLGLTWLGGNSSLPKILYANPDQLCVQLLNS